MKKLLLLLGLSLLVNRSFSQDDLERLLSEGIKLHDEGKYEQAIKKYDSILQKDRNNYMANYEKSYTLLLAGKPDECIQICNLLVELDPKNRNNNSVYVNWGTAFDDKGDAAQALKIYEQGIKLYPDFYLLHFNKGVTLSVTGKYEEGLLAIQKALTYNPLHAGSHQLTGRVLISSNRIPAVLAFFTFLLIEPESQRAKENYANMNKLIMKGVSDNPDGKGTTISIDPSMLDKKK